LRSFLDERVFCCPAKTQNMPRIPIFKLGSQAEAPPPRLTTYTPTLSLDGLHLGIDNVRHDVWLSPALTKVAGDHIGKLIAKYGNIESLAATEAASPKSMFSKFVPSGVKKTPELKPLLLELHKSALNRAKAENNPLVDLLARASVIKFLRTELNAQYAKALEQCRGTLKGYEGVRQQRAFEYRETVASFQIGKKRIIRQAGQDLFRTLREIEREALANMRRSLFGEQRDADYQLFLHQLIFLEEGRDSYLAAENYVLIGGFENDPDSFGNIRALACEFLKSAGSEIETIDDTQLDGWLNAPENAHELVGTGEPSERDYKTRLQLWIELLDREKLLDLGIAAYEVVSLLPEFTPLLDPQQLKYALVFRKERDRVEKLIEEHGKLSRRSLDSAADRVSQCSSASRAKVAARLLRDFMLYHRDLRRLEVLNRALEKVNLIANEKLRDLSNLNGTLYEFVLAEETKDSSEKAVVRHVILKADIRDSSRLTRSLLQREMNPASYFSMNFYDPVNKLLSKYGAHKVFVEGDAIILAMLEREGDPALSVSRACVLAREMVEIVGGYNHLLQRAGLPPLELGVGISFQDSSPMYLLDGDHRIMISDALNESDRLSSCDKRLRKAMEGMTVPFNVYEFRPGAAGDADPMKYNVGGIRISEAAFNRLRTEVSLEECKLEFPRLWGSENIRYWSALVPVGADIFRRLLVRVSQAPIVETADLRLLRWTENQIFEVCTNPAVYTALEQKLGQGKS
jgi:class 3 adenylate cyclase